MSDIPEATAEYRAVRNAQLLISFQDELRKLIDDNENSVNTGHCDRCACDEFLDEVKKLLSFTGDKFKNRKLGVWQGWDKGTLMLGPEDKGTDWGNQGDKG